MIKLVNFIKKYFYIFGAVFIMLLIAYITYKTPLAGDDWGYALNGMHNNPFKMAVNFYKTWSGRFFSELWGFIAAPNKFIWNIINPLNFLLIFLAIAYISGINKKTVLATLFALAFILSVDDNLRMETYSWLMGETYIIPLTLSLLYFTLVTYIFYAGYPKLKSYLFISTNLLLIISCLMMENIAATLVIATLVLAAGTYFYRRRLFPLFLSNFILASLAFIILRLSPGASYRTINDHPTWVALSLLAKLKAGYPVFLEISFIKNNYAIALFSLVIILFLIYKRNKHHLSLAVLLVLIQLLAILTVFSFIYKDNFLNDPNSLYSYLFWPVYVISVYFSLLYYGGLNEEYFKIIFYLSFAGITAVVMIYSPIYGSRSAIYLIFYMLLTALLILKDIQINKFINYAFILLLLIIIFDRTNEYLYKYNLVGLKEQEREIIYQYYRNHPEVQEAWIPRFPVYTIHGGDIEEGDTYHFETFKEYYKLPQDATKIIFYWPDN